ncbi:hypothetical protein [Coleofasciculus sp. E2-BRE-01]|uniref:hypothetical protein n=1 Tax=Coleofasciculus sp. E2-BRE-01 TaxID=3069524 RepID=UPI004063F694
MKGKPKGRVCLRLVLGNSADLAGMPLPNPRVLEGLAAGVKVDSKEAFFEMCRRVLMTTSVFDEVGSTLTIDAT